MRAVVVAIAAIAECAPPKPTMMVAPRPPPVHAVSVDAAVDATAGGFFCSTSASHARHDFCVRDRSQCETFRTEDAADDQSPCAPAFNAWCYQLQDAGPVCTPTEETCSELRDIEALRGRHTEPCEQLQ